MNFKNLKIGAKLSIGFGLLIVIVIILGSLAILNMSRISKKSTWLAKEYAPEVEVANKIERNSLLTIYNMRGYGYTEEKDFLNKSSDYLKNVRTSLNDAKTLARSATQLVKLNEAIGNTEEAVNKYEKLVEQTIEVNKILEEDRKLMDEAAAQYIKNCNEYLASQNEAMTNEIGGGGTSLERLKKISLINDIIDLGNATRVGNFKSQATRDPEQFKEVMGNFDKMKPMFEEILKNTRLEINIKQVGAVQKAADDYHQAMKDFLANWEKREEIAKERNDVAEQVLADSKMVSEAGIEQTLRIAEEAVILLSKSSTVMIAGLILALILGVAFALLITKAITGPVSKGVLFAQHMADGDLTANIDIEQKDEIGMLATALRAMKDKLKEVISFIVNSADNIAAASQEMSANSQQVSQGASEQASSAEEVSSSMEEMAANIEQNTENAKQTEGIALNASKGIAKGNQSVEIAVDAMNNIADKIKIINDIAFQTNILALNAAVEAARAGEHGKGFAVVAAEVRKLAERSKIAADEIDDLSRNGVQVSEEAGKQLAEIVPEIEKTAKLVQEISAASLEQNSGADQVNAAIQQLNQVTQQNAAAAEEMATSAEELSAQADQLKGAISFFKIDKKDLSHNMVKKHAVNIAHIEKKKTTKKAGKKEATDKVVIAMDEDGKEQTEFESF
ncbi:MAG: HAMP domain-containing protein [Bacteroidales bacterium]|nr:HAMP domain-containing protein [Bacteroidales bacterium]